ncbi:MAG: polysaccharide biosynthesis C-terminal domain-containing protein, partial [Oscillospiraceae bacterium]|nr:polysaccharide biosynthesis C-terminal domain-containing protein [Oscillospiraceae bacterium]
FSIHKAKAMLRISYPFIFAAIMTTIYGQTDKIMLKNMLSNEAVASYSVALTLAGVISIVPAAVIEGFRPDIMTYKLSNEELYKKRLRQLYAAIFWLCIAFCLFVTFFAKYIVLILYGEKYLAAIPVLSLVVWYTSFSYFGAVNSMYMVAESKAGWVQVTTLVGMLLNICMNFILIPVMGAMGAALASLLTQIVANFILIAIVPQLRGCFRLIIGGIFLQKVF